MALVDQSLTFGDVTSSDYNIYISGEGVFNAPKRRTKVVEIPGRNGDLAQDLGSYENINVTYPAFYKAPDLATFADDLEAFRAAIASKIGYQRLTDTIHPDQYRMGLFIEGLTITPVEYNTLGKFDLVFNCMPQRWLRSGETKKTVAALKGRRWVADYDEGLQKIFFRQDITATIYALADWFSPADTESPTLEFVSFYDRKTHKQKKLKEVPDILYSEVMRDVDLAVSVAHVGGVDPETSHSTIEMRRAIFAFNMELFGITNVTFEGTHAFIKGTLDNYSVQLGSGVIHKESGGMVNILPVHSQQRGKIFLPFIDEDPKTAEILSKILLLAEDQKIKDPYILEQLR